MYYRKSDNLYVLADDDGTVLATSPDVSIAFDVRDATLLKHGTPARVLAWQRRTLARYHADGLFQEALDLVVVTSCDWDVLELERILSLDGYLQMFCAKNGITTPLQIHDKDRTRYASTRCTHLRPDRTAKLARKRPIALLGVKKLPRKRRRR